MTIKRPAVKPSEQAQSRAEHARKARRNVIILAVVSLILYVVFWREAIFLTGSFILGALAFASDGIMNGVYSLMYFSDYERRH